MSPNPSYGELASVTINNMSTTVADNVTQNNAILNAIKKSGNVKPSAYEPIDGGLAILEAIEYQANVNTNSYSGYDVLGTAAQDVLTSAVFPISQYSTTVVFNGLEELENAGKEKIIDVVEARVENAFHSLSNRLNSDLYLDGTGNNGKNVTGLLAAVPLSPTNTYGGISRSSYSFWANKKFQASVDGSGVATGGATLQSYWQTFHTSLVRGKDAPTAIIAGQSVFALYQSALTAIQRIMDADTGGSGFKTLEFMGIPVILDTVGAGMTTTTAYFLNTDFLKWRPHKDRDFVTLDDREAFNMDATARIIVWAGQLTCNASFLQGIFSNT